jgi:cell wall-associated NlpC family hydrolase
MERLLYLTTPRMSGADVYQLEQQLESLGYKCTSEGERKSGIGIFGPACDTALRAFQRDFNVDVYGKVDQFTRAALADARPQLIPQFVAWLKKQVGQVYVWGGQGHNLTEMSDPESWIRQRDTSSANAERSIAFYKKRVAAGMKPSLAYDCSGLVVKWLMDNQLLTKDTKAAGLYKLCQKITREELKAGDLLFRKNIVGTVYHVGVYIGDDIEIEAKGRDDGVVRRHINAQAGYWNGYGRLPGLK